MVALGCNKPVHVEDYHKLGTEPGFCHHCHTGLCPVGVTTQIPELQKRLTPEQGARWLKNYLSVMVLELQTVAWLAVGVALGAAYHRTLPAIFTALTGYIAVLFLVVWRYPSLMTPLTALVPISGNQDFTSRLGANILVVHQGMDTIYDASGHAMNRAAVQSLCPSMNSDCPAQHHLMEALRYQTGSRIHDFHLLLACGYFALGAITVAVVWWLVRRTSLSAG